MHNSLHQACNICNTALTLERIPAEYTLLPAKFATPSRIAVLKKCMLQHEDVKSADFFLACVRQFIKLARSMGKDERTKHSISLVSMLQRNIEAYQAYASAPNVNTWPAVKVYLADCPIFLSADLPFPYDGRQLVSLKHSEDHANYRLVGNAAAVTSNAMGDTNRLRAKLDLPTEPQLAHVVEHLLTTA